MKKLLGILLIAVLLFGLGSVSYAGVQDPQLMSIAQKGIMYMCRANIEHTIQVSALQSEVVSSVVQGILPRARVPSVWALVRLGISQSFN